MRNELPGQLRILNDEIRKLQDNLEERKIRITALEHGPKINQFFQNNIPNIVSGCQGLLRGEPTERHELRLSKEFSSVFINFAKIKELPQSKEFQDNLNQIESILNHLNQIYKQI